MCQWMEEGKKIFQIYELKDQITFSGDELIIITATDYNSQIFFYSLEKFSSFNVTSGSKLEKSLNLRKKKLTKRGLGL